MANVLKTLAVGVAALALSATSALAFTTWSSFEAQGYQVKARYDAGKLVYVKASNPQTGETFQGPVSVNGIAVIKTEDDVLKVDVKAAEARLQNRTTLQDFAEAK